MHGETVKNELMRLETPVLRFSLTQFTTVNIATPTATRFFTILSSHLFLGLQTGLLV